MESILSPLIRDYAAANALIDAALKYSYYLQYLIYNIFFIKFHE